MAHVSGSRVPVASAHAIKLRVIPKTHVQKIVVEGGRAIGVNFNEGGLLRRVLAEREVIVATGAIGSPQLLQLSGIGDGEHLSSLGLDVVHDNPNVGQHLQDHLGVTYYYKSTIPTLNTTLGSWPKRITEGVRYLTSGQVRLA